MIKLEVGKAVGGVSAKADYDEPEQDRATFVKNSPKQYDWVPFPK